MTKEDYISTIVEILYALTAAAARLAGTPPSTIVEILYALTAVAGKSAVLL